jgi:Flp pilus assembly secretin CpaC
MMGTGLKVKPCLKAGAATFLLCMALMPLPSHAQQDISVYVDYARVLKFDRTVSKVIIGNPEIADVTVSDPQTIVLTGRSYGTTNLVVLDADGAALVDERIVVGRDQANTLRVYRNVDGVTLTCAPTCEEAGGAAN